MKRLLIALLLMTALPLAASDAEAPEAPASTPAPSPQPSPHGGRTQLFQVILLRGATSGPEELVGLPKNAEKAIHDVRDFLPFKSYKLLDSGLVRIEEGMEGAVRLDGIAPQQYDVRVAWQEKGAKLSIWHFAVMPVRAKATTPLGPGVAPEAERPLITTAFSIDVGETIVVGSSKLGGNQALVILFTAVPK
jgi:hypothetical protein